MKGGTVIYAPATFAERGAAIPFTTPTLSQTRVRPGERYAQEILIPSFAEGKGIYVIPWKSIPDTVSMTVHDRYLHQLIGGNNLVTPADVRAASLKAARNGLAGPEAAKQARATIAQDQEHQTVTHFLLLIELMRAAGLESLSALRESYGTKEGDAVAKRFVQAAAKNLNMEAAVLYSRLSEISAVMSPIGLVFAPQPGRLRQRLLDLATLKKAMIGWADDDVSDAGAIGKFCAGVAGQTLDFGQELLRDFDRKARSIGAVIRDWNDQVREIATIADKLGWLTDGWDFIAASWNEALQTNRYEQQMAMYEIFRVLPLLPTQESEYRHAEAARTVMSEHRRTVKAYEDWRSGVADVEMIRRIETAKGKAAA